MLFPVAAQSHVMRKKVFVLATALAISLSLNACGGSSSSVTASADNEPGGETANDPVGGSVTIPTTNPATNPEIELAPEVDLALMVRVSEDFTTETQLENNLNAEVRQAGMPATLSMVAWSQLEGPGQAIFLSPNSLETVVTFDQAGDYTLQLMAYEGGNTGTDTLFVTVTEMLVNVEPTVDAGDNQSINFNEVLNLQGVVSDDGLPADLLSTEWIQTSGPANSGQATFSEPSAVSTDVTFSAPGNYILQLSASDGVLSASDRLQIVVKDPQPEISDPLNASRDWQIQRSDDGSKPQARHEAGGVAWNDQLILLGGRGRREVSSYNPQDNKWRSLGTPNKEMHHFQPVVYDNRIFILGALDHGFPSESVHRRIQIFDPATRKWSEGDELPSNRRRGSAGTVVYKNKIYMVGGTTNGHDGGTVNWFDEYDPITGRWKTLPNAPTPRDHFYAAVVGNRLVAASGRQTDYPDTFENLVNRVDVYNFDTGKWETNAPSIPQQRAGAMILAYGPEVVVIGGETEKAGPASNRVDAYNVYTQKWRRLKSLKQARHGGGAAILNNEIHVASGNTVRGGSSETTSHEKLQLD